MRRISIIGGAIGLCLIVALVARIGAAPIGDALRTIGWLGFCAVCAVHLVVVAGMGLAWRAVVPGGPARALIWGRLVRDAGSEILPFSQIGGLALGARAVVLAGLPATVAAASTVVDVTLEFIAKLAYLLLGLLLLLHLQPASPIALPLAIALAIAALLAFLFVAMQRYGLGALGQFIAASAQRWAEQLAAGATVLHASLGEIYRRRSGLWLGFLLHLACWIASALEVWAALYLGGLSLDFATVLVIECLLYGIRTFAFAIPNAIGVQEASYVVIGTSFGLTPEIALALSLLKRARDLTIGLPTLVLWPAFEGRRLWRRAA